MQWLDHICEAGKEAIVTGREVWGTVEDNEIREEFLSALMAVNLHRSMGCPVRTEVYYTTIANLLGRKSDVSVINAIGGLRADILVCDNTKNIIKPRAIIEVKKFDEFKRVVLIERDLSRPGLSIFDEFIPTYVGVFVCETADSSLSQRMKMIEDGLRVEVKFSEAVPSLTGAWKWCFAAARSPSHSQFFGL